jgi:hypothetical protein
MTTVLRIRTLVVAAVVAGSASCQTEGPESAAAAVAAFSDDPADVCGELGGLGPPPGMTKLPPPPDLPRCDAIALPDGALASLDVDSNGELSVDELAELDRGLRGALSGPVPPPPPPPPGAAPGDTFAAPPGPPPREVLDMIRQRLADLLWVFDGDASGGLSAVELDALAGDVRAGCEVHRARAVERLDANGDGDVDDDELADARARFMQLLDAHRGRPPEEIDSDGDGTISPVEHRAMMEAARAGHEARRAALDAEADTDGSGELDAQEEAALRALIRARIRAGC